MNNSLDYLKTFFEEKIEHIFIAPEKEQDEIANICRRIDFANGDINHFLKFLAVAIAK